MASSPAQEHLRRPMTVVEVEECLKDCRDVNVLKYLQLLSTIEALRTLPQNIREKMKTSSRKMLANVKFDLCEYNGKSMIVRRFKAQLEEATTFGNILDVFLSIGRVVDPTESKDAQSFKKFVALSISRVGIDFPLITALSQLRGKYARLFADDDDAATAQMKGSTETALNSLSSEDARAVRENIAAIENGTRQIAKRFPNAMATLERVMKLMLEELTVLSSTSSEPPVKKACVNTAT